MTEISYVWDGVTTGDATLAPYDKEEFNKFLHLKLLSTDEKGFIIPGYLNDLRVENAGPYLMEVAVTPGAALFNNYVYVLDDTLTLAIKRPTDGYWRVDTVVLRLITDSTDSNYQTVRVAILEGAECLVAAAPPVSALTQTVLVWEIPLAYVHVDNPVTYNYIPEGYIHDLRKFITTDYIKQTNTNQHNLIKNSEFIAVNHLSVNGAMHWWMTTNTSVGLLSDIPTDPMLRGFTLTGTTDYAYQDIPVASGTKTFILRGLSESSSGSHVILYGIRKDKTLTSRRIYRTYKTLLMDNSDLYAGDTLGDFQENITFEETDIEYLRLCVHNLYAHFGQFVLTAGYHSGPYRKFREIIPYRYSKADAAWTSTAKSTGLTLIDLTASFVPYTNSTDLQAVILRIRGRDSGSAAAASCYLRVLGYSAVYYNVCYGSLELAGVTNDVWREMQVIVPVFFTTHFLRTMQPQFRIEILATGAGTFDATVEVVGVIT